MARKSREELGLEVSPRNALRVIEGQVEPLMPLCVRIDGRPEEKTPGEHGRVRAGSALPNRRFSPEDLESLKETVAQACAEVAGRYFLEVTACRIRRSGRGLAVFIDFDDAC